jgi:hypothetical protein
MFVIDVQADIFSMQHIRNIRVFGSVYRAHSNAGLHHCHYALVNSAQSALRAVVSFSVCWHFIIKCGG